MNKILLSLVVVAATLGASANDNNDPVLMTINGKPVTVSEFNYLFNKNNQQQAQPQNVDEYLDMFVNYKLKVANAEAAGMQDTEAFKNEYATYQRELAQPYLIDNGVTEQLAQEFYNRLGEEIEVGHIMLDNVFGLDGGRHQRATLDSIRTLIVTGQESMEDLADKFSVDPSVKRNHGHLGWMTAGRYPYSFENVAYATPKDSLSQPFETPFGWHIVQVFDRRPSEGEVLAEHILIMTRDLSRDDKIKAKERIDSISAALAAGADFGELAKVVSEDPGSGRNGGRLPWFGRGRMVPQFEEVAFSLKDGEISKPFKSDFGWHIIHRIDSRKVADYDEIHDNIVNFIERDDRRTVAVKARTAQLRDKHHVAVNNSAFDAITSAITAAGHLDENIMASLKDDNSLIITVDEPGRGITVSEFALQIPSHVPSIPADQANGTLAQLVDEMADNVAIDAERVALVTENPDYRNLLNEYHDGMLLFEISDRQVWNRAKEDTEGLNEYFNKNKEKYTTWTSPRFKGFVIFATSDSISDEAKQFLAGNPLDRRDVAGVLQAKYGKNIKVERVIAAEGENAIIDYLAFGGEEAKPLGKWVTCFVYQGEKIDQPVEPDDVRGQVTTDYQNYLEQQWLKDLHKRYKVKINKKVLKELRAQQPMPVTE